MVGENQGQAPSTRIRRELLLESTKLCMHCGDSVHHNSAWRSGECGDEGHAEEGGGSVHPLLRVSKSRKTSSRRPRNHRRGKRRTAMTNLRRQTEAASGADTTSADEGSPTLDGEVERCGARGMPRGEDELEEMYASQNWLPSIFKFKDPPL